MKSFTISKKEFLPKSEVLIEGEISKESVEKYRPSALDYFQQKISVPGFRKGNVPEKILIEKVGEINLYEEAASRSLIELFPEILQTIEKKTLGNPKVSITKISPGQPVGFRIEIAIMPDLNLPDYKIIAKEKNSKKEEIKVEEKEINEALDKIRRSLAHHEKFHSKENQNPGHSHDDHTGKDIPESELPSLDDQFAKKIGNFPTLEILKEKIKESLLNEKKTLAVEKNRLNIIEKIIEKIDIDLPKVLIESELSKMLAEFRSNLERMGIELANYLKHIQKNLDDLKNEWKDEATKRAKIQLALKQISDQENIKISKEQIDKEVEIILKEHKEATRENVESFVRDLLVNEKVWNFLENLN